METNNGESNLTSLKLSVVLSFFNEAEVLPALIERLRSVLGNECSKGVISKYELIFVNDASTDNSEEILIAQAKTLSDIKIITMSRNFGVSPCVLAGMEHAAGDIIVYMDADLQDPPEVIPEMLKALRSSDNIDVVNTVRLRRKGEPFLKLLMTKIGYKILKRVMNINFLIDAGDFKLLTRRAVNQLVRLKEKQPFLRGLVYWIGFKQVNVYYHRQARCNGRPKFPLKDFRIIHNFLFSALIAFSDIPLRIALLIGVATTICSFFFLVYVIIQKFALNYTIPGWTAFMAVIIFIGGIQLLTIGIVGLYINAIFLETKARPNYIIDRIFGFNMVSTKEQGCL